ncbi:MAG: T9SS type A sorting domain-containing protein [Ignavibacteriales bacterium]|nr:MAG: T9SS type A sorting domain-containing protein [Ignavibacteriales bacterium]
MKRVISTLVTLVIALFVFSEISMAQTPIDQWGSIGRHGWPIINSTTPGNAGMGGTGSPPAGAWATLRGGFAPLTATTTNAVVVTGKVEFVGGGPTSWSALRYGIFRHDSAGTLINLNTDTVRWSGLENNAYGYMFSPHSGTNDQVSGNGGNGTQWSVNGGSWISTFSGGNYTLGVVNQAPARAPMSAGIYNWAFSVRPMGDGTHEVRWYIVKEDNGYWFGGIRIDTSSVGSNSYNGVVFGINPGNDIGTTGLTQVNLSEVQASLGTPITIPEAPFEPFYVEDWGSINRHGWPIIPGGVIGNCGMGGTGSTPSGAWATLRGGFIEPLTATPTRAIIVTGKVEFVGGGPTSWSALRYGLFRHDSAGTVQYANTDTARWGRIVNPGTDTAMFVSGKENDAYGFMFTPHSGTNDQVSGNSGNGTQWSVNGGSWISTFSGGNYTMGVINQAPARAPMSAGTYNWAFSVRPMGDGTHEIRWYIIKDDNSYWFGGTHIDTSSRGSDVYNGIVFGINPGNDIGTTGITGVNLTDVFIDLGDPINVPEAPWQGYYLDSWGFMGDRTGGWDFLPGAVIGNAGAGGTQPNTDWVAMRGGLISTVDISAGRKITFTGKMIFEGGGFEGWSGLRYGLFYGENPGNVVDGDTTLARWTGSEDNHSGYLFLPPSGTNELPIWAGVGGAGSYGGVINSTWLMTNGSQSYVLGANGQQPANAVAGPGTYDFSISVADVGPANEIIFNLAKDDGSYTFSGTKLDYHNVIATEKFNGIYFALNSWEGSTTTSMKVIDVFVDREDVTGIEDEFDGQIPAAYDLKQNFPNPFNPATTIQFALPRSGEVNLVVYDVLGKEVARLASGEFSAGTHTVHFNASNLASGVYFYKLDTGDFVSVKKLLLVK